MMKRWLPVLLLLLMPAGICAAWGDLFTPYPDTATVQTRAPFGYRPFYISHYGRHGSRYMSEEGQVADVMDVLKAAREQGLLTAEGEMLCDDILAFDAAQEGLYGQLAPPGAVEHRHIARRMYRNFKPVFSQRRRREVHCISSMLPRCIVSMANCCLELQSAAPALEFDVRAGLRYYKRLNTPDTTRALVEIRTRSKDVLYPLFPTFFDDGPFFGRIFSDPLAARDLCKDWIGFFLKLYDCTCDAVCAGIDVDLARHLSEKEIQGLMRFRNCIIFAEDGRNPLNWEARKPMTKVFLDEILTKADAAVAGGSVAADLRFGHDSGLSGLLSLMGVKGYDVESTPEKAWEVWDATEMMPMASNLQLVFYRNIFSKKVLVKLLFNERETSIPALGSGPYYPWDEFRAYLGSL